MRIKEYVWFLLFTVLALYGSFWTFVHTVDTGPAHDFWSDLHGIHHTMRVTWEWTDPGSFEHILAVAAFAAFSIAGFLPICLWSRGLATVGVMSKLLSLLLLFGWTVLQNAYDGPPLTATSTLNALLLSVTWGCILAVSGLIATGRVSVCVTVRR